MPHRFLDQVFLERLVAKDAPASKLGKEPNASTDGEHVYEYLKARYPASLLQWVRKASWTKRVVALDLINMARRPGGRNPEKVEGIAKAVKSGKKMEPIILVNPIKGGKYEIADGFHRTLGFEHAGRKSIMAWVAHNVPEGAFDRDAIHEAKKNVEPGEKAQADGPSDISPIDRGKPMAPGDAPGLRYPQSKITFNGLLGTRQLNVHVANSPKLRALGFQGLPDEGYSQGALLMQWPYDQALATLHNSNIPIPLGVSFHDAKGHYVDHLSMGAHDKTPRSPGGPHKYALEMHQNQADELGFGPGTSISMADEEDQSRNGNLNMGSIPKSQPSTW